MEPRFRSHGERFAFACCIFAFLVIVVASLFLMVWFGDHLREIEILYAVRMYASPFGYRTIGGVLFMIVWATVLWSAIWVMQAGWYMWRRWGRPRVRLNAAAMSRIEYRAARQRRRTAKS